MKLGGDLLSAWRLWLIKADQQSMSWHVFSSLPMKLSSPDATFQLCLLFFCNWPLGDWLWYRTLLRNVTYVRVSSSFRQHRRSLAHVLPIALFFNLSITITIKQTSVCSWPLVSGLYQHSPPLLHFPPPDQLTLWVS